MALVLVGVPLSGDNYFDWYDAYFTSIGIITCRHDC
jgi:hypothetical protein